MVAAANCQKLGHLPGALDFSQRTWTAYIPTPTGTPSATPRDICPVPAPTAVPIPIPIAIHEATFIDFIGYHTGNAVRSHRNVVAPNL